MTSGARRSTISRRGFLRSGFAMVTGLGVAYVFGCGDGDEGSQPATGSPTPGTTPRSTPAVTSPPAASALGWRQLSPGGTLPIARRDHSLTADAEGSRVYMFGGRASGENLSDLWVHDVDASAWSQLAPEGLAPAARFGHNAIFDPARGRVVVFGGQAGSSFFSDVWAYDPAANSWSEVAGEGAGPAQRYGAGGDLDPATESLVISHGFTNQGRFDDTWNFALGVAQWSDSSPASGDRPVKRCLLRTVVDRNRGRLVLFGGQTDGTPFLGDLWAFDLGGRAWTELGSKGPSPRNLYSAVVRSDEPNMILFGGSTDAGASDELWSLDFATDQWTQLSVDGGPPARSGHDATWLAGRNSMLVFGGRNGGDLDDLWELTT